MKVKCSLDRLKVEQLIKLKFDNLTGLAEHLGVSRARVSRILASESLHMATIKNIANALDVEVQDILVMGE